MSVAEGSVLAKVVLCSDDRSHNVTEVHGAMRAGAQLSSVLAPMNEPQSAQWERHEQLY